MRRTAASAWLAAGAAGWLVGGIFSSALGRGLGLLAPGAGVAVVALSTRARRPAVVQWLVLPVAVVAGAVAVVASGASSASLPALVREALRSGGIAQPPVPFDPGWRFLVVAVVVLLGAAATAVGLARDRPGLAVALPVPILFGAALLQPPSASTASTAVAVALMVGALATAFAEPAAGAGRFEARRAGRAGGMAVAGVAAMVSVAQLGFLFPEPRSSVVVPPRRPETSPPQQDRVLFTVNAERAVTWRLGVLDTYRDRAWLTAPYDAARFEKVPASGAVPGSLDRRDATLRAAFTIADVSGRTLPALANPQRVEQGSGAARAVEYDPRTQSLRLSGGRAGDGFRYTVDAAAPPAGAELARAQPPPDALRPFLETPAPPPEVVALLAGAPKDNAFNRLQYVRDAYFAKVVSAGPGNPTDVPPSRVVEMLAGREASPYEITAGEALVARWAGVPARIGYGFFGGDPVTARAAGGGNEWAVRPKHGANWLEVYFEGFGWVPIVGTPPRAKASLSEATKKDDTAVKATDQLALVVFVPVRLNTLQLLYTVVRFWLARLLPLVLVAVLLVGLLPLGLRAVRRSRRRRWARSRGPWGRIAVAYAELRDGLTDLGIGGAALTPLELVSRLEEDRPHAELAWLVTRGLWGDLRRELTDDDADAADDLARSLLRRVRRAQPGLTRLLAVGSRASLRSPWSRLLPNAWPSRQPSPPAVASAPTRRRARWGRPVPVAAAIAVGVAVMVVAVVITVPGDESRQGSAAAAASAALPRRLVPDEVGDVRFQREPDAESAFRRAGADSLVGPGLVYTLRHGTTVQASLQAAPFGPGVGADRREVRDGMLRSIGAGSFRPVRLGHDRAYALDLPEQHVLLWFPTSGNYYELLVARRAFDAADDVFARILAFQRGEAAPLGPAVPEVDWRRGLDQ